MQQNNTFFLTRVSQTPQSQQSLPISPTHNNPPNTLGLLFNKCRFNKPKKLTIHKSNFAQSFQFKTHDGIKASDSLNVTTSPENYPFPSTCGASPTFSPLNISLPVGSTSPLINLFSHSEYNVPPFPVRQAFQSPKPMKPHEENKEDHSEFEEIGENVNLSKINLQVPSINIQVHDEKVDQNSNPIFIKRKPRPLSLAPKINLMKSSIVKNKQMAIKKINVDSPEIKVGASINSPLKVKHTVNDQELEEIIELSAFLPKKPQNCESRPISSYESMEQSEIDPLEGSKKTPSKKPRKLNKASPVRNIIFFPESQSLFFKSQKPPPFDKPEIPRKSFTQKPKCNIQEPELSKGRSLNPIIYDLISNEAMKTFCTLSETEAKFMRNSHYIKFQTLMKEVNSFGSLGFISTSLKSFFLKKISKMNWEAYSSFLFECLMSNSKRDQLEFCFGILSKHEDEIFSQELFKMIEDESFSFLKQDLIEIIKKLHSLHNSKEKFKNQTVSKQRLLKAQELKVIKFHERAFESAPIYPWETICRKHLFSRQSQEPRIRTAPLETVKTSGFLKGRKLVSAISRRPFSRGSTTTSFTAGSSVSLISPQSSYQQGKRASSRSRRHQRHLDSYITFKDFSTITFTNKGLPDLLFIIIILLYGNNVCNLYTKYKQLDQFSLFTNKKYGMQVKKVSKEKQKTEKSIAVAKDELVTTARMEKLEVPIDLRKNIVELFLLFKDFELPNVHAITNDSFVIASEYLFGKPCKVAGKALFHSLVKGSKGKKSSLGFISFFDFINSLFTLKDDDLPKLTEIMFGIYDIDGDGKITATDTQLAFELEDYHVSTDVFNELVKLNRFITDEILYKANLDFKFINLNRFIELTNSNSAFIQLFNQNLMKNFKKNSQIHFS